MKKTKLVLATTLVLMLSFATTAFAGFDVVNAADVYPQTETIYIDNTPVEIDTININGSKYIPLRKVSEALGCTVDYKEDCITVIKDQGYATSREQTAEGNMENIRKVEIIFKPEFPNPNALPTLQDKKSCERISYSYYDDKFTWQADQGFPIDAGPVILDSTSYIPLRYLCQSMLNCKVSFVDNVTHITSQPLQQFATE